MCGIGPWSDFCNDDSNGNFVRAYTVAIQVAFVATSTKRRRARRCSFLQVDDAAAPQLTDPPAIVIAVMNDGIKLRFDGAKFWPRGVAPMRSPLSK
jgi:hypothetical protein